MESVLKKKRKAGYSGKDLQKKKVLSLEWKSEDDKSGESMKPVAVKFTQDSVYQKLSLLLSLWLHANSLCDFLKVQWLHFAGEMDKVIIAYFPFSGFYLPKIIKIGYFWLTC